MTVRPKVIWPIFKRNFASYFSGVLAYLFIVVFVVAGGAMAFNARFFTANEPSLDQLTQWFPLLLLFFVPACELPPASALRWASVCCRFFSRFRTRGGGEGNGGGAGCGRSYGSQRKPGRRVKPIASA